MTGRQIMSRVVMWLSAVLAGELLGEAVVRDWGAALFTLGGAAAIWWANVQRKDSL